MIHFLCSLDSSYANVTQLVLVPCWPDMCFFVVATRIKAENNTEN